MGKALPETAVVGLGAGEGAIGRGLPGDGGGREGEVEPVAVDADGCGGPDIAAESVDGVVDADDEVVVEAFFALDVYGEGHECAGDEHDDAKDADDDEDFDEEYAIA